MSSLGAVKKTSALTTGLVAMVALVAFEYVAVAVAMPVVAAELGGKELYGLAFSSALAAGVVGTVLGGRWADQAVTVTSTMDSPRVYADALVDAGTAYRALGNADAARRAFTEAREQYLAKGATELAAMLDPEAGGEV